MKKKERSSRGSLKAITEFFLPLRGKNVGEGVVKRMKKENFIGEKAEN